LLCGWTADVGIRAKYRIGVTIDATGCFWFVCSAAELSKLADVCASEANMPCASSVVQK